FQYKKWLEECQQCHYFKKSIYPILFVIFSILLTLAMCISANFTTVVVTDGDVTEASMNMFYYFVVFWPIIILYIMVTWYAFLKKFNEYNPFATKKK
ncbi:MAG: hypothetical protein LBM99_01830, partial [Bacillales bacterium]|nr:hypothetical protein [Bacillales bacterium]